MHWIRFPMKDSKAILSYAPSKKKMSLYLLFRGDNPSAWFQFVKSDDESFGKEVGLSFDWKESEDGAGYGFTDCDFDHVQTGSHTAFFSKIAKSLSKLSTAMGTRHKQFFKG